MSITISNNFEEKIGFSRVPRDVLSSKGEGEQLEIIMRSLEGVTYM